MPCSFTELARSAKTPMGTTALSPAGERTGRSPMCGATRRPTLTAATWHTCRVVNAAGLDHRSVRRQAVTPPASSSGATSICSLSFARRTLPGHASDLTAPDPSRYRSRGRERRGLKSGGQRAQARRITKHCCDTQWPPRAARHSYCHAVRRRRCCGCCAAQPIDRHAQRRGELS